MIADVTRSQPDFIVHLDPNPNDQGDYYYLRWEHTAADADPQSPRPPATELTLHRTGCEKQWP